MLSAPRPSPVSSRDVMPYTIPNSASAYFDSYLVCQQIKDVRAGLPNEFETEHSRRSPPLSHLSLNRRLKEEGEVQKRETPISNKTQQQIPFSTIQLVKIMSSEK